MPPCSCLPRVISVDENVLSLDVTMVFLMYMGKLVCSNRVSGWEVNMGSAQKSLAIVINKMQKINQTLLQKYLTLDFQVVGLGRLM